MNIIKMRYSIHPRDRRYVKGYGFLSFAKNIGKNISSKYSEKLVDSAKQSATDAIKTASKRAIQKTAEATGDLIGNKTADKITSSSTELHSKKSPTEFHSKELHSNEANNEIPKERYISPQVRQQKKWQSLIDDASNQPSKFRKKSWGKINDESRGTYNVNSQIKFKTAVLKSSLCDYSDAYILVKGTIAVNNTAAAGTNIKVIFKNNAPFTNCISEINNTQVDNAKDIDIVMPMYNLIEHSNNYSKTSGSLWQYCKDMPAVDNINVIVNFAENNLTDSFNFKAKMTGQTGHNGRKKC